MAMVASPLSSAAPNTQPDGAFGRPSPTGPSRSKPCGPNAPPKSLRTADIWSSGRRNSVQPSEQRKGKVIPHPSNVLTPCPPSQRSNLQAAIRQRKREWAMSRTLKRAIVCALHFFITLAFGQQLHLLALAGSQRPVGCAINQNSSPGFAGR